MPDLHAAARDTMQDRAKAVLKQHNAAVRSQRRASGGKTLLIVGLGAGLAWTVYNNNQLATKALGKDVVYATLQTSGDLISSVHYTEIASASQQAEAIQNALWKYVEARECFNTPTAPRAFYIAQAMSDDRVGRQVKRQFDPTNPEAPQHVYGEKGIAVQCEPVDPPAPQGGAGDIYFFHFRRWEDNGHTSAAEIAAAPSYSVAVRFRTGIFPKDPRRAWLDRSTFNAPGLQVIDFPGAQPDNARPAIKVSSRQGEAK